MLVILLTHEIELSFTAFHTLEDAWREVVIDRNVFRNVIG